MEALLFHPKLVHLPIALGVLMPLVAGGILLSWWRGWLPHRTWHLALGLQAVLVLSGLLALRSGEAEEERVERVVPERYIEAHEEAAEGFVAGSFAVLVVMLLAAVAGERKIARPIAAAGTAGTLIVLGLGYRTGEAGGRLVYEHGAASAYATHAGNAAGASPTPIAPATERHEDDDDD
jgi:uncharacterized membrane protein